VTTKPATNAKKFAASLYASTEGGCGCGRRTVRSLCSRRAGHQTGARHGVAGGLDRLRHVEISAAARPVLPRLLATEDAVTEPELLAVIAMEECDEVSQRIAKAARFSMDQIQQDADDRPEQNPERLTNRERIVREYYDLRATLGMLGIDAWENSDFSRRCEQEKVAKVRRYFQRSRDNGTLV
jgi:hypothetical protein